MYVDCASVSVCLSPTFSGSAIQQYIRRVDSSRLNVSLDITHKAPPERVREGKGGWTGGMGLYIYMCVRHQHGNTSTMTEWAWVYLLVFYSVCIFCY